MNEKKIIAIIPARGGSKGIPKKNIRNLLGKPLIGWTIEQAKASQYISEIYVSTDDREISEIAKLFGASVINRPKKLARDNSPTEDALIHLTKQIDYDIGVLLQCTSPLRYPWQIDEAIEKFIKTGADSLLSGYVNDRFIWKMNGGPINYDFKNRPRRQDKNWEFVENGSIYIFKRNILLKYKNRLGGKIEKYIMPKWMSYEIDTMFDFEIIEFLMKNKYIKHFEDKYLKNKINRIKMIIFDIDGVFTDGSVIVNETGHEMLKFSRIDGKGIENLINKNYLIVILSSEKSNAAKMRMKKLGIREIYLGIKDKLKIYEKLKSKYNLNDEEICFCGDDINDVDIIKRVGLSCCPCNSNKKIKELCDYISIKQGGNGFVREISDLFCGD